jgi:Protein of unknown function (DUF3037)
MAMVSNEKYESRVFLYIFDIISGEYANLGVLLAEKSTSEDRTWMGAILSQEWACLSEFLNSTEIEVLQTTFREISENMRSEAKDAASSLSYILEQLASASNGLILSEPEELFTSDPASALDELATKYLTRRPCDPNPGWLKVVRTGTGASTEPPSSMPN